MGWKGGGGSQKRENVASKYPLIKTYRSQSVTKLHIYVPPVSTNYYIYIFFHWLKNIYLKEKCIEKKIHRNINSIIFRNGILFFFWKFPPFTVINTALRKCIFREVHTHQFTYVCGFLSLSALSFSRIRKWSAVCMWDWKGRDCKKEKGSQLQLLLAKKKKNISHTTKKGKKCLFSSS